ncbi:unnamed protein product [Adineta steineri]|uniref:NHL repeat containing protein-like protein n=1 Tax=Adineta steineri TaxID=433720 RepID=A0A819HZI1_9BILA|nr:unnamed protein product [Adineta steineri]
MWPAGSAIPTRNITGSLNGPYSVFVTANGDVYVDNGFKGRVRKWTLNATTSVTVMYVSDVCYGLFVDMNNTIYCSQARANVIVASSPDGNANSSTIVAGNGSSGSTSNMLYFPMGIFVDVNFNLYVADSDNDRIQFFKYGQMDGTTVVGEEASVSFALRSPTSIVLDANSDLFIVDSYNTRIVRSSSTGFRCVIGCTNAGGSNSDQLPYPWALAFDSYGNIFVSDYSKNQLLNSPDGNADSSTIVAGTGSSGSTSNMLYRPIGIFVDINFNLYVADSENDRIQFFKYGQMDGMTVAGVEASVSFALSNPTSIVLDANDYLFIVDSNNNRIVRSDPTGFRCLVGCTDAGGSDSDQLRYPWALAFDSYGNIFVTDEYNNRIQKFIFQTNSCVPITTTVQLVTTGTTSYSTTNSIAISLISSTVHESWHIPWSII